MELAAGRGTGSAGHRVVIAGSTNRTRGVVMHNLMAHPCFVRARLACHKISRSFEWVEEPLRDDVGKVRRWELRAARMARSENAS
jgi:bile acid-coenzyme A ligase